MVPILTDIWSYFPRQRFAKRITKEDKKRKCLETNAAFAVEKGTAAWDELSPTPRGCRTVYDVKQVRSKHDVDLKP